MPSAMTAQDAYWLVRYGLIGCGDVRVRVIDHVDGGWAIHITAILDAGTQAGGIHVSPDDTARGLVVTTAWIAARIRIARAGDAATKAARAFARQMNGVMAQLPPVPPPWVVRSN